MTNKPDPAPEPTSTYWTCPKCKVMYQVHGGIVLPCSCIVGSTNAVGLPDPTPEASAVPCPNLAQGEDGSWTCNWDSSNTLDTQCPICNGTGVARANKQEGE